jgi:hypothetical protein
MPALVAGIHAFPSDLGQKGVDGRHKAHKAGHDEEKCSGCSAANDSLVG